MDGTSSKQIFLEIFNLTEEISAFFNLVEMWKSQRRLDKCLKQLIGSRNSDTKNKYQSGKTYLKRKKIKILDHPFYSPDL
jgi:hypothetical protein